MPETPVNTFALFSAAMAVGIVALLPVVPLAQIGRRFFILSTFLSVVFVALAIGAAGIQIGYGYLALAGLLILYNLVLPRQSDVDWSERRETLAGGPRPRTTAFAQGVLALAAAVGGMALVLDAVEYPVPLELRVAPVLFLSLSFVTSALLVGGSLVAMVLGHWYLVARKLSFAPLARICLILMAVLILRIAVSGFSVWAQFDLWRGMVERAGLTSFFLHPGMFLLLRVLFGFAAPLALLWMTWKCVEIRSNQSATGILYVTVAFVLMGELIAKYMLVSQRLVI